MSIDVEKVLASIEHGWATKEKALALIDCVRKSNSRLSVEIGVFGGKSFIPLALAHKEMKAGYAIGIDAWNHKACLEGINDPENNAWWKSLNFKDIYYSCVEAIERYDLDDYACLCKMTSLTFGILLPDNSIDVMHQDSNHSEEVSCAEINLFASKMKSGSYWIMDDTDWPTMLAAQELIYKKGFELQHDYIKFKVYKKQ
jgi:hypothetical protein